jgi:hypothetical protein
VEIKENALGLELWHEGRLHALYRVNEELTRSESPKPCFAPIYTPSGGLVTEYRPGDHAWHTGLYFGWVHANDANLWGGPWYLPETKKYEYVDGTHGIQRHDNFPELSQADGAVVVRQELTWLDGADVPLAREERKYLISGEAGGYFWRVETRIDPLTEKLILGASRAARYSGFELRLGPPFSDADLYDSEGRRGHEAIMGQQARWVAASGASGGGVAMLDHPNNPRHPTTWFARKNLLGAGLLMESDLEIAAGEPLALRYGFWVGDEAPAVDEMEKLYEAYIA